MLCDQRLSREPAAIGIVTFLVLVAILGDTGAGNMVIVRFRNIFSGKLPKEQVIYDLKWWECDLIARASSVFKTRCLCIPLMTNC